MCRGVKRGGQLRRRRRYQGQPGHSVSPWPGQAVPTLPMLGLTAVIADCCLQ